MARVIELKTIPVGEGKERFSYLLNLRTILNAPVQDLRMNVERMRRLNRVWESLEGAKDGDTVTLEESDYQALREQIEHVPFAAFSRPLLLLIEDIETAKEIDLNAEAKKAEDCNHERGCGHDEPPEEAGVMEAVELAEKTRAPRKRTAVTAQ